MTKSYSRIIRMLLILFILLVFARSSNGQEIVQAESLPPITIHTYGLETMLLYDAFGDDESKWTDEQMQVRDDYFSCIADWWSVATQEQKEKMPKLTLKWLCWKWTYLVEQS